MSEKVRSRTEESSLDERLIPPLPSGPISQVQTVGGN